MAFKWEILEQYGKKYRHILLILLVGIVLMAIPTTSAKKEERTDTQEQEVFSVEETERRMTEILGRIEGAGKLEVMLTLKSGSQLALAEDVETTMRDGEEQFRSETVTIDRGSGYEEVVVTRQTYPAYQGALVVCQGADLASVRLAVTEAVAALTGLSSDRITVAKWNS